MRFYHFLIVEILLKVWIWYRCQNRIGKHYHHSGEQLGCYKKVHAKIHRLSKKKDVIVILVLQKIKNSNLFDKNRTQDNVKCHIKHDERWLRWIVIELVNYKWHYFSLILPERNFAHIISKSLRESNCDVFWENEGKIHEGRCVKELFL